MAQGRLFIGTSGWVYSHWDGIFYPEDLPSKDKPRTTFQRNSLDKGNSQKVVRGKLKYFSQYFKTAEINYSFYHLPRPATYQNWYNQVPADFIFAVKASRYITHIKRLREVRAAWEQFLENALNLKEKLGPILFQFPPSFSAYAPAEPELRRIRRSSLSASEGGKATSENIKRLEEFLKYINHLTIKPFNHLRFVFEFRHQSWCEEEIYKLLKKYNVAWVIADSPSYPRADVVTADFVYIRMHGSKVLFASKYTKKELSSLAQKIKKWLKQGLDVYCYFNNDACGYAIENAKTLQKFCK